MQYFKQFWNILFAFQAVLKCDVIIALCLYFSCVYSSKFSMRKMLVLTFLFVHNLPFLHHSLWLINYIQRKHWNLFLYIFPQIRGPLNVPSTLILGQHSDCFIMKYLCCFKFYLMPAAPCKNFSWTKIMEKQKSLIYILNDCMFN